MFQVLSLALLELEILKPVFIGRRDEQSSTVVISLKFAISFDQWRAQVVDCPFRVVVKHLSIEFLAQEHLNHRKGLAQIVLNFLPQP